MEHCRNWHSHRLTTSECRRHKGLKQVQQTVSAERGANITMVALSVIPEVIAHPSLFFLERISYHECLVTAGPLGCLGLAHPSS